MWIFRFTYCLIQGHAFVDIPSSDRPYQYCLHCGKMKEPIAILKRHTPGENHLFNNIPCPQTTGNEQ
jgi:hypothetical protein